MATTESDSDDAPLVTKRERLLAAAEHNDLETFKELLNSPSWYLVVTDDNGNNLLHIAILRRSTEVFNYLLSLDDFPLYPRNHEGQTALDVVLTHIFDTNKDHPLFHPESVYETYAIALIKKDAKISYHHRRPLLNLVVDRGLPRIAQLLLERGADPNISSSLHTAVHCVVLNAAPELIIMLLNYGADTSILDSKDYTAFDRHLHLINPYIDDTYIALDDLFFFTFYEGCTFRFESLVKLALMESPLFQQVINFDCKVLFKDTKDCQFCHDLFCIDFEYFRILLEKYPYAVKKCVKHFTFPILSFLGNKNFSAQKLEMLMQNPITSKSCFLFIEKLGKDDEIIPRLVQSVEDNERERDDVLGLIYYFLSYGMNLHESDLKHIYRIIGFSEDYKNLLIMDFQPNFGQRITVMMPRLSYDVTLDIHKAVDNPSQCEFIDWGQIFYYFAHPKIQNAYRQLKPYEASGRQLPHMPLLQELARDKFRKHFIEKYNITTPRQFYTILRKLRTKFQALSYTHEKIITYQTKLYNFEN